jgi:D-glycero-alpha-D-manno-heptose-7-phosphate kinase
LPASATARGWCRVDLAGGTLDIWPLGLFQPSQTINFAVDIAVRVRLEKRSSTYAVRQSGTGVEAVSPEDLLGDTRTALIGHVLRVLEVPPVAVDVESASPRGGGLGASSALAVSLIAAARRLMHDERGTATEIAELARDIEARMMRLPTGTQDHFPALLGGALVIEHRAGGPRPRPLGVDLDALGDHLVVAHSGVSHFSALNNWEIVRRALDGDSDVNGRLESIAQIAEQMRGCLEAGDWAEAGRLVSLEWDRRRGLSPAVSSAALDRLMETAMDAGAWGGKACGAGGGGCVAFLVPIDSRQVIEEALDEAGAQVLSCRPAGTAMEVTSDA